MDVNKRQVGDVTILALKGDAVRGEKVFWAPAVNCGGCHKVGDRGTPLGPDLSAIGRARRRADLLVSILDMYGIRQDTQGDSTGHLGKL